MQSPTNYIIIVIAIILIYFILKNRQEQFSPVIRKNFYLPENHNTSLVWEIDNLVDNPYAHYMY
jgi:uncharacterized membrane protein YidH (DUF202 family)